MTGAAGEEPVFESRATHNLFGMTGLIDMPSAEMQPDGQVTATVGYHGAGFLRNTLSAQIFPGVEGAFRYSVLDKTLGDATNPQTLHDRSFDLKLRLIEEGPQWPAVAVGLQDFLGTGVYSGEYIALTKNVLDGDLKVTGGVGWGRLAGRGTIENPLAQISDRLRTRNGGTGTGGDVNFGQYFQGEDIGLFGGLQYDTPVDGLTLKAEYSSDTYDREGRVGGYQQDIPLNFGVEYQPWEAVHVGAYYLYGGDFGLRVSVSGNPFKPPARDDLEPGPLPLKPRPVAENATRTALLGTVTDFLTEEPPTVGVAGAGVSGVTVETRDGGLRWATATLPPEAEYTCPDRAAVAIDAEYGVIDAVTFVHADGTIVCTVALRPAGQQAVLAAVRGSTDYPTGWYDNPEIRDKIIAALSELLEPDRIGLFGLELQPRRVEVYVENRKFNEVPRAIGRVARALSQTMPPSVEVFEIIPVEDGLPVVSVLLQRSALEDQVERPDADRDSWLAAVVQDAEPPDWSDVEGTLAQFPRFNWSINPSVPVSLFDPDQPVRADLAMNASGSVELTPGLSVNGTVRKRIIGQLDNIERKSDSKLPHVRSDIAEYLKEGDPAVSRLTADYVTKLDDDIYARLSGGLLELMHAGVSGEVLWKPVEQSWGLGAELNWSKQRDFDGIGFRDYDVVTGHASLYWDTGFYGVTTEVDAGRYLAGDWGGTLTVTRVFPNGWELGGFFTLTDVPFDEFGEGSFDKGIILRVPFNWFVPVESQSAVATVVRPLTRDGGQRLQIANRLYPTVEGYDRQRLKRDWGGFWE